MLSAGIKLIYQKIDIWLYINHFPIYKNPVFQIHIPQMSALYKFILFRKTVLLIYCSRKLRTLPGILADRKQFSIHCNRIMCHRIFKFIPIWSCYIIKPPRIHQNIFSMNHQINMQFIRMSMPCSKCSTVKMQQICFLSPIRPQIIISAVRKSQREKRNRCRLHLFIFPSRFHSQIPDTFKIQSFQSSLL